MAVVCKIISIVGLLNWMPLELAAQEWHNQSFGFELGYPGISGRFSVIHLTGWYAPSEQNRIEASIGYGGKGRFIERNQLDRKYNQTLERFTASVQWFYNLHTEPSFLTYAGAGPFYAKHKAEIGQSYIFDMPEDAITAHSGAHYELRRIGLLPSSGVKFFAGNVTFDLRLHIPLFYEKSTFSDIEEPLLVVDFEPYELHDYQKKVDQLGVRVAFDVSIGFALQKRKWWHVIRDGREDQE